MKKSTNVQSVSQSRRKLRRVIRLEQLENRNLFAADWSISGTSGHDEIYIARESQGSPYLIAEVNGVEVGWRAIADVRTIRVTGLNGDDHLEIDQSTGTITLSTVLNGGAGNDTIIGGAGKDTIYGGDGNDRLLGNANDDVLYGENGNDYLDGGIGVDFLDGGTGQNVIVPDARDHGAQDPSASTRFTNRVPAEWEKHDSTWMQWPKGEEVANRANFAGIIGALQAYEQVNLVVESSSAQIQASNYLKQRAVPLGNIVFHIMPYDWSWMRDNGAIWVEKTDANGKQSMVVQDWGFDGWGGDGGPSRKDDAVPPRVAAIEKVAIEKVDVVLEKGTLEFNGKDTVITSWTVLHDRNPTKSKAELETILKERFGVSKVVWLEGAPEGDITDGHVDGIARFINERTVAVVRYVDQSDPDAALFERAAATIRNAGFSVVRLDMPGYIRYKGELLPANYANYLVANGVVIASSYGNAEFDARAKSQLQQLFPDRKIILTDTRELWLNGGAVHCVTNEQPLLGAARTAAKAVSLVPVPVPNPVQQVAVSREVGSSAMVTSLESRGTARRIVRFLSRPALKFVP
jgi:agmatine deiminase